MIRGMSWPVCVRCQSWPSLNTLRIISLETHSTRKGCLEGDGDMFTSEVVNVIEKYLSKAITLEELEDWLVPRLPLFFKLPHSSLTDFIAGTEVALADMAEQRYTEDEFRTLLGEILEQVQIVWISYPAEEVEIYTRSSNQPSPEVQYVSTELSYALA